MFPVIQVLKTTQNHFHNLWFKATSHLLVLGSEVRPEEEYFDWLSIVEMIAEKEEQFYDRHKKVDCRLQNLCKKLSDIFSGQNLTKKEQEIPKPTLAIDAFRFGGFWRHVVNFIL